VGKEGEKWAGQRANLRLRFVLYSGMLPKGNLPVPVGPGPADETGEDPFRKIGLDHREYGHWLALSRPGEGPRPRRGARDG
jgi:hypothetical protein